MAESEHETKQGLQENDKEFNDNIQGKEVEIAFFDIVSQLVFPHTPHIVFYSINE